MNNGKEQHYVFNMKTQRLIIAMIILTGGCAAPPRYEYVKEGASEYQRVDALSECEYQIKLNKTPANEQADLLRLCMQGKGFRLKRINEYHGGKQNKTLPIDT